LRRLSTFLALSAAFAMLAGQAIATPDDDRLLLTPKLGWMLFSDGADMEDAPLIGGALGMHFNKHFAVEASYSFGPSERTSNGADADGSLLDANLLWFPMWNKKVQPFLSAGWGSVRLTADDIEGIDGNYGGPQVGAGAKIELMETQTWRLSLRLEAKDTFVSYDFPGADDGMGSNISAFGGLTFAYGPDSHKDTDGDGVIDKIDACAETPMGVVVDARGCPIDSDGDGVFDGPDQCADTPMGATVDARGCPSDGDNDGVLDGLDSCPNTPAGALIDSLGCEYDTDTDNVLDGIDQCPDTPLGVAVDETGCPTIDSEEERTLYETGTLILPDIEFESGKAELKPGSEESLAIIADAMRKWPNMVIEVGGHTDSRGSETKNQEVSLERAEAVRQQLLLSTGTIPDENLVAKGYGPSEPIADNETEEGRAQNRRVQFKILSGGPTRN